MTAIVPIGTAAELEQRALPWPDKARALAITNQQTYEAAGQMLLGIKDLQKEIEAHHGPMKKAAYDSWQTAIATEKKVLAPLQEAETILKSGIATYTAEQRRIEEQRRREAEEAERRRIEEEQEAAAAQAEREGASPQEVQAIIEQPVVVPRVVAPGPTFQPVQGVRTVTTWCAEVTSVRELCRAIADGKASPELVTPNMPALNKLAIALKRTMQIPGVRAVEKQTVAAGRR